MLLDDFSGPNKKNINKKYVVYLEGKPAIYYANLREAEGDIDDIKKLLPTLNLEIRQEVYIQEDINNLTPYINESLDENLKQWFKEKWVRFGPDGKIRGDCARGDSSEGKPKCLPQAKAHALGKKGRKYAASKKRREDPNPERSGSAINVATKKKTNEDQTSGIVYATGPRTTGTNDVDLIFKNLTTNKIVAWVVGNNDDGGVYEIRINQNGVKKGPPNFVATGNPQDDSDQHLIYKLGKPGTGRMSAIGSVMQNGFDKKNSTYYGQPLEFVGDDDWWSFLENIIGDITWEDDAIDAGYVDRLDNGDLVFVKQNLSKDSLNELAPDPGGGGGGGGDEGDDGFELPLDFKGQNIMVWPRNKKHSMGDTATPFPRGERFTGKVYIMWDQPKIEAIWYLDPKDREDREKEYKRVYEPRGWEDYLDHKWYDTTGVRYRLVTDWKLIPAKEPGGWPGIVDAWGQDMKGEVMNYPESFITEIIQKDGDGRHFVEPRQSVAEGQVNEFAPGDGSGEGRWYTDDQMIDIVGPDWAPEDDTGHLTLGQRLQDAQAWLDDQGYSVVVEDVQIDPEGGYRWKIYGEFYNPRFAKKDQGLAEDSLNEFAPTKSVGNFNRGGGGTGRGGDDDRNERDDSDDEGIINKILQALERLHPDPFETYGGEVEDVVVNLVSGGRLDDYIRAVGLGNIPMKELIKQGVIQTLKELKELYGDQGVAESQKSKHNISEFGEPPMIGWFKVGDIISGKLRDGRSYTGEIEEITVRPSGKIKQLEMAKVKILTLEGEEIDYRPIVSVWTRDPDLKKLSNRNQKGVAEGFTDDINLVYAMHPQPEESERVALGILDMDENEFIAAWQKLPAEYQEEFNFDLPLWNTDELKNYKHITLKVMKFADYVKLVEDYIRSQEMSQSAVSALKKGVAEGQVNEFAPDDTNDGIWYNDNKIAKIVGRWWLADDLLSNSSNIYMYGDEAKESATQEAEEQLREKGFYVNVLDVRENTKKENLDWLISGPLVRVHIGEQGITEATNRRKEATLRIQKMLNDKFNANLDVDGILGPLTIASINKFMPNAKVKLADEPNRTTAVQGNKMKKENVNLESRYGDQYNVNKTTSVSLAKELNDMVLELGELIAASPKHPSLDRLKDKIVALNQELNDLGYDYDPQAENFLTPITLDMRNLHEGICPQCKGSIVAESMINEKKDSCYYKVKSRYKVWPSAYASGALVQCRKKGAKNWGKKNESKTVNDNKIYFSIPKSLANETELRESFNLRHDAKGWYLKEGQENFKKSYKDALKAFPLYKDTSEGLDMSKGTGSAPIKGDDFVLSPVGSIPKNKK